MVINGYGRSALPAPVTAPCAFVRLSSGRPAQRPTHEGTTASRDPGATGRFNARLGAILQSLGGRNPSPSLRPRAARRPAHLARANAGGERGAQVRAAGAGADAGATKTKIF